MLTKEQRRSYRQNHLIEFREYQRKYRATHKEQARSYSSKWKLDNPDKVRAQKRKYVKKRILNEDQLFKRRARESVKNALKRGKLVKKPCENCGKSKVDAHHDSYTRPLDVRWLCRLHHQKLHSATLVSLD